MTYELSRLKVLEQEGFCGCTEGACTEFCDVRFTCCLTQHHLSQRHLCLQTRFSTDERVYKAFLEILNMYRKGQKTITNVYEEVSQLLLAEKADMDSIMPELPLSLLISTFSRDFG